MALDGSGMLDSDDQLRYLTPQLLGPNQTIFSRRMLSPRRFFQPDYCWNGSSSRKEIWLCCGPLVFQRCLGGEKMKRGAL
jgi:hypothetical protein